MTAVFIAVILSSFFKQIRLVVDPKCTGAMTYYYKMLNNKKIKIYIFDQKYNSARLNNKKVDYAFSAILGLYVISASV